MVITSEDLYFELTLSDQRHRRFWPINEAPSSYRKYGKPAVTPGDLVVWKNEMQDSLPIFSRKKVGLVLQTRWVLADWLPDEVGVHVIPEAKIYWNDGDMTNSAHSCLEKAS